MELTSRRFATNGISRPYCSPGNVLEGIWPYQTWSFTPSNLSLLWCIWLTLDYTLGSLFQVRLHNPADVQVLARDILNPTWVIYESGVIFVAEEDSLSYLDVGNVVKLDPKALKKPRLQGELCKRGLLGQDERVSVAQMRSMLSDWIMENPPASPKRNGLISLLDDLSPWTLCSNEDRTILFVSQRNSPTILEVAVSCTGTVLKADSESFITITRKACCTGLAYNKETRDILVANSENDGGIYIVDTELCFHHYV